MSLAVLNSRIKKMECEHKPIPQKYVDCFNDYIKKIINIRVDQEVEYLNDIIADKFELGKFKSVNELIYAYKSLEKEYTKSRQRIAEIEAKPAEKFDKLFETKKEAEWHKEFGCIERTERLVLPTWEEFKNKKIKCVEFTGKETNCLFELYEDTSNNRLILLDHDCDFEYFNTVSTKENYTIACRQCVKLFKGE